MAGFWRAFMQEFLRPTLPPEPKHWYCPRCGDPCRRLPYRAPIVLHCPRCGHTWAIRFAMIHGHTLRKPVPTITPLQEITE